MVLQPIKHPPCLGGILMVVLMTNEVEILPVQLSTVSDDSISSTSTILKFLEPIIEPVGVAGSYF